MKVLLDTHAYLWAVLDPGRLSPAALAALRDGSARIYFSAASAWEIAIKARLGKLKLHLPARRLVVEHPASLGLVPLPVTAEHAAKVADLPMHHADPFDRLLVAQADLEGLVLLSRDPLLRRYDVDVRW